MPADQNGSTNGNTRLVEQRAEASVELDDLRATCRRQAHVIEALTHAVLTLRSEAAALKADNVEHRADANRLRGRRPERQGSSPDAAEEPAESSFVLDIRAPAAARAAVASALRDRVSAAVLGDAQLLVSELVTNSVLHSGASPGGAVVLRVQLSSAMVRLDVEDSGGDSAVVARPPELDGGGGFGLNLVHTLSERWGVEHALAGGLRVWAQLSLTPPGHEPPPAADVPSAAELPGRDPAIRRSRA
jgi:anti-sigma regulatory factor (Ser/Thr protein kinase)